MTEPKLLKKADAIFRKISFLFSPLFFGVFQASVIFLTYAWGHIQGLRIYATSAHSELTGFEKLIPFVVIQLVLAVAAAFYSPKEDEKISPPRVLLILAALALGFVFLFWNFHLGLTEARKTQVHKRGHITYGIQPPLVQDIWGKSEFIQFSSDSRIAFAQAQTFTLTGHKTASSHTFIPLTQPDWKHPEPVDVFLRVTAQELKKGIRPESLGGFPLYFSWTEIQKNAGDGVSAAQGLVDLQKNHSLAIAPHITVLEPGKNLERQWKKDLSRAFLAALGILLLALTAQWLRNKKS